MRQFKPGPDWTFNDQLTVAPEYLNGTINYIKKLFHAMITKVNQQQNLPAGQRPNVTQGPSPITNQSNIPPLNASNLQQHQQQQEALQRARRASGQSASGSTSVPQPPFGAPSPQGVPHAYGPGSFPPEKLKLPPPKKRKQSHAGGAASPVTPTSKVQENKQAAAEAKPNATQLTGPYKCSVPECQHHYQGFVTQPALAKHIEENHKAEEPITDALEYALESFRMALCPDVKPGIDELNRKGAAASPVKPQVKTDGATPANGATPMGRVSSQIGLKPASPASNQNQTPRTSLGKAPTSAMKQSASKDGKMAGGNAAEQDTPTKDPWADCAFPLEAIQEAFMFLRKDTLPGWIRGGDEIPEPFTKIQSKDSPDSIETGVATQTPRGSDTSKEEDLVKIESAPEDSWIPVDWSNLPSRFEDGLLMNESWEDLDWETVERKDAEMNMDDSGVLVYAM